LIGAVILALTAGDLFGWVVMWLVAGIASVVVGVWFGWREAARRDLLRGMKPSLSGLRQGSPGVLRFSLIANMHSSLALLPGHIATFSVGMVLGAQPAGLMKVAQELGTALAKPIDLINQSVYPDISRLSQTHEWKRLRRLVARSGAAAAALSAVTALLLFLVGRWLITQVFGDAFEGAYWLVVLISLATTLNVSVFAVDPALYALGRPSRPLLTAIAANSVFVATMFAAFPRLGLYAPGAAYLAAGAVTVVCALIWMGKVVPRGRNAAG